MFATEAKQRQQAGLKRGQETAKPAIPSEFPVKANLPERRNGQSRDHAATLMNVSPRSVENAARVQRNGTPKLQKAVEEKTISISAGAEVAKLPPEQQDAIVEEGPAALEVAIVDDAEALAQRRVTKSRVKAAIHRHTEDLRAEGITGGLPKPKPIDRWRDWIEHLRASLIGLEQFVESEEWGERDRRKMVADFSAIMQDFQSFNAELEKKS